MLLRLPPAQLVAALLAMSSLRRRIAPPVHPKSSLPSTDASTAIGLLHERLPEAFQSAGLSRSASVTLWGVQLSADEQLTRGSAALLASFLRARDWDVDDTTSMLGAMLHWRRDYHSEALRPSQFTLPCDRFAVDDSGCASVSISIAGAGEDVFDDVQRFVAWRICMIEQLMQRLDFGGGEPRYTLVLDCRGMQPYHVSRAARRCAKALSSVMQDNYPDFIGRVLVVSPPRLISLVWGAMGPFLPQSFSDAVQMCDEAAAARAMGGELEKLPAHACAQSSSRSFAVLLTSMFGWLAHKVRAALTMATELATILAVEHPTPLELAAASTD